MDTTERDRGEAWSSYWKSGALHSCIGSYTGNYGGAIQAFWSSIFRRLDENSHILDIATGNGALPKLLVDEFPGAFRKVDAIDYSVVEPGWYDPEKFGEITFHSKVAMEQLPFEDSRFDVVISQYGLEYGRRPESLEECLRVAKESAIFAFMWHRADGILVRVAEHEIAHIDKLLASDGLVPIAVKIVPWLQEIRRNLTAGLNPEAMRCRALYNESMSRLGEAIDASQVPDLLLESREYIHGLVSSAGNTDATVLLEELHAYRDALVNARLRSAEMIDNALDEQQAHAIQAYFKRARPMLHTRLEPVNQGVDGAIGWGFIASLEQV